MSDLLFRPQAVFHKQQRLLGEINLAQPKYLSYWIITFVILLAMVLCMLLFTSLNRKEKVQGNLVPSAGLIHVVANSPGRISDLHIREGDEVAVGSPLISILNSHQYAEESSIQEFSEKSFDRRINLVEESISENENLYHQEMQDLRRSIQDLTSKLNNLHRQKSLIRQRLNMQQSHLSRLKSLKSGSGVSTFEILKNEDLLLSFQQIEAELEQQALILGQEIERVKAQQKQIPLKFELASNQLRDEKEVLELRREESKAAMRSIVTASQPGKVTTLQTSVGQPVTPGEPLLSLQPSSPLVADLYLPSSSVGLVTLGKTVNLRFDAFPYQKFGQLKGEIIQVDESALQPSRFLQLGPEPRFRVRAELSAQRFDLGDQVYRLKAGMTVEADIVLERRRLFDWFVEPFLGFRERLG